jgi:hypothetical protein
VSPAAGSRRLLPRTFVKSGVSPAKGSTDFVFGALVKSLAGNNAVAASAPQPQLAPSTLSTTDNVASSTRGSAMPAPQPVHSTAEPGQVAWPGCSTTDIGEVSPSTYITNGTVSVGASYAKAGTERTEVANATPAAPTPMEVKALRRFRRA